MKQAHVAAIIAATLLAASPAWANFCPTSGCPGYTAPQTSSLNVTPNTITVPASGTAPTGATQMSNLTVVSTCSSTQPLQLPPGAVSGATAHYKLSNRCGSTEQVYPPSGGTIDTLSTNIPANVGAGVSQTFDSASPGYYSR